MNITELTALLRECAGADEMVDLEGDVLDVPFADLGYDSLAVLQTTGRIERDYAVSLDEEAVAEAETPRAYLEIVNSELSSRTGA
ncbi:acyl carrier protein [Streptomyces sp. TRM 70351]|uniref:acyl carrier protein n=1 Tax=Streptomyces sp. TRM 70351 TaxID=3116552 RepID=UPI002E7C3462|nr:acyl carrier protein [Streptomyces sp. TRM 70351]MEE1929407.1 acyl carrier protein [Streptomyces sp. TRM 70351]